MDEFEERLGDLDGIDTGSTSWSSIEHRDPRSDLSPGPHNGGRRLVTIVTAFAVFAAAGGLVLARFDRQEEDATTSSSAPPSSMSITCTVDGVVLSAEAVVMGPDGVRLEAHHEGGAASIALRRSSGEGFITFGAVFHELKGSVPDAVASGLEPGTWEASCIDVPTGPITELDLGEIVASADSRAFEIADPNGYWPQVQDSNECGESLPPPASSVGSSAGLDGAVSGTLAVDAWDHRSGDGSFLSVTPGGAVDDLTAGLNLPFVPDDIERSPDGERYLMEVQDDADGDPTYTDGSLEDGEIWVVNADGSGLTKLTDNHFSDGHAHWSPDGTEISFVSDREDRTIFVMNADGSSVRRLTPLESADSHEWSPDGSRIVLSGSSGEDEGDGCGTFGGRDLYVVNRDGSNLTRLTDHEWYVQDPSWSPDGSKIVFIGSERSDYAWEVLVIDADGSGLARVTDYQGYESSPHWSPDGRLIAFSSDRDEGVDQGEHQGGSLFVMNADGSGVTELLTADDLGLTEGYDLWIGDWRA